MRSFPRDDEEPERWPFAPGDLIRPGLFAWQQLGAGQRCATWLAWSAEHCGPVVVKLPHPQGQHSSRTRDSLRREASRLTAVNHPAFQRLLATGLDDPVPHLVYEYVEGPTLDAVLDDHGPLPAADVALLALQIGAALHHLHGRGLAHLDLKPANLVLRSGRVVLLDLGLAQPLGAPHPPGRPRGSVEYMAPEQIRCQPATVAMDLFGLGAVLYELATDDLAFPDDSDNPAEPSWPQLSGPPVPPRAHVPDLPAELEDELLRLLATDPRTRPPDVAEVLRRFAALLPAEDRPWPAWVEQLPPLGRTLISSGPGRGTGGWPARPGSPS